MQRTRRVVVWYRLEGQETDYLTNKYYRAEFDWGRVGVVSYMHYGRPAVY